jgi:ketosteroid isomerase-like protein
MSTSTSTRSPEATIRELFAALDAGDFGRALPLLADDVRVQFGNLPPTVGRERFHQDGIAFQASIGGIAHSLEHVWAVSDRGQEVVVCEMAVTYTRLDGSRLTLPCANSFRLRDGQVADYRVYMDIGPVFVDG